MSDDIESSFQDAIQAGKINGAVICATDTQGTFTYNKALGERILLSGETIPQEMDDVLYLASATKILATIAALQCVDDGLLTLDGDLSAIAPELTSKEVLIGFSEDGETPIYEPALRPITLEMLLTHSSGLVYHFMNPAISKWREKFANVNDGEKKTVEELFCYPLSFQPGQGWMYGPGLDWAGRIVERVTGFPLGEWMQKRLFHPLGINDAQFFPVTREDLRDRLVNLSPDDPNALGRAVLGDTGGEMNLRGRGHFGGHGMFMPATSFVKILHSILSNDGKLLRPETVDEMFQHRLEPEATASHQEALKSPMGKFFLVGVDVETKCGYGLGGLLTLEDVDGWYGERTMSWGGGQTVAWFIDRKNGLCGIGAPLAKLPLDIGTAVTLKQVFRHDIFRKHAAWKANQ
ncbi:hypothetical protein PENSTE_c007G07179 [Penicillium steckii]|uniref:Beta-lactamase-related domain-containing protein n=1 Tax=Penicillium steckii TaxID=303698 RepID=A0A1V6TET2_9EURO|nr:hypothetical protein PENSTE_c007G07179 [Penicillium steckii]